jgi:hypothetical protein
MHSSIRRCITALAPAAGPGELPGEVAPGVALVGHGHQQALADVVERVVQRVARLRAQPQRLQFGFEIGGPVGQVATGAVTVASLRPRNHHAVGAPCGAVPFSGPRRPV